MVTQAIGGYNFVYTLLHSGLECSPKPLSGVPGEEIL
jgi:hypothetical protein